MPKNITNEEQDKLAGRVYTPNYIVQNILDLAGYFGDNIIQKHIIDNSCGNGAFLVEIINRYCEQSIKLGYRKKQIATDLSTYIHGIEIDQLEHIKCIENVNNATRRYGITNVQWDILCADTLSTDKYDNKMDFVVGNPPYIRIHNLGESINSVKSFSFSKKGMTDLYIVFFELGLRMLKTNGILGYITPSSYFNSIAGDLLRKELVSQNYLRKIVDLKHFQPFNATTYTCITILQQIQSTNRVEYYKFNEAQLQPYLVCTLSPDDYYISNNYYFSQKNNLDLLKRIFYNLNHCGIAIKNGFATLCDKVFINSFPFSSKYIIPVIKASRGQLKKIIYPYNRFGQLITEDELQQDISLYQYLLSYKKELTKRSIRSIKDWYAYGRSQAIVDTFKNKIAINNLIKTVNDIKLTLAPAGTGVYGGLYLVGENINFDLIKSILICQEFVDYIAMLGKYKSGGYYTFSSKDIKAYLDYKLPEVEVRTNDE